VELGLHKKPGTNRLIIRIMLDEQGGSEEQIGFELLSRERHQRLSVCGSYLQPRQAPKERDLSFPGS